MKTIYIVKGTYTIMGVFEEEDSADEFSSQHAGSYVECYSVFKNMDEMKKVSKQVDFFRSLSKLQLDLFLDTH